VKYQEQNTEMSVEIELKSTLTGLHIKLGELVDSKDSILTQTHLEWKSAQLSQRLS
jgi:hypothetical protein